MARYTRADLDNLIDNINAKLAKGNSVYRLAAQGRNGYVAIDLFKDGREMYMVGCGTAKEAANVAMGWVISNAVAIATE